MIDKRVLVATVNYKQNALTIDCLESIRKCGIEQNDILVFDNGNSMEDHDSLEKSISGLARVLHSGDNIGYINGVNRCLALAQEEKYHYILILNNDTVLDDQAVDELVSCASRNADKCIVTGIVYDYDEKNLIQTIGSDIVDKRKLKFTPRIKNEYDDGKLLEDIEFDLIDDIFWLVPVELVKQIGLYNTAFWFNAEQADFALRARKSGYKLIFTPRAKLWHKGSASVGGRDNNPIVTYWNTQSKLILKCLHIPFHVFICELISSAGSALIKMITVMRYNDMLQRKVILTNCKAVLLACLYVFSWVFVRRENSGQNPFLEKY